jgi:hypothetical protein
MFYTSFSIILLSKNKNNDSFSFIIFLNIIVIELHIISKGFFISESVGILFK